jgi:hypothetical protein
MRPSMKGWSRAIAVALSVSAGCAEDPGSEDSEAPDITQYISEEKPNEVAQVAARLYANPQAARISYATGEVEGGCTGFMIGPNIMLTAAHCGDPDTRSFTFYAYRDESVSSLATEKFRCRLLLNTFHQTDMTLHYCDPNAAGENPGDKYGYLDLDVTQPVVNSAVLSAWFNPVTSLGLKQAQLFSRGKVTATNVGIWGSSGAGGPQNELIGIGLDLWSQPGCSGSAIVNASNTRVIAGPTSTGSEDKPGRNAQSMKVNLERGSVDGWLEGKAMTPRTGIHDANILALGLTPSAFKGKVDKDGNYLFDIQEQIEQQQGESARDVYDLGFGSERRNALWERNAKQTTIDSGAAEAHVVARNAASDGYVDQLVRKIPFSSNSTYRMTFLLAPASLPVTKPLRVALRVNGLEESSYEVDVPVATRKPRRVSFELGSVVANELAIAATEVDARIVAPVIYRADAALNFDSADARALWSGAIVPSGKTSASTPNWAGLALPATGAAASAYPLSSEQLGFMVGARYRVCASIRSQQTPATGDRAERVMRVRSGTTEAGRVMFKPSRDRVWRSVCVETAPISSPATALEFGFAKGASATGGFLVDDVVITRLK